MDRWSEFDYRAYKSAKFGFEYEARFTDHNGVPVYMFKASMPNLSVETFDHFRRNYLEEVAKIENTQKFAQLPDFQGCMVTVGRFPMPNIMSDRSFI